MAKEYSEMIQTAGIKEEAVARMKMLKLHGNVIRDFLGGKLNASENGGILFWLNDEDKKLVENVEKENNVTVYHVIKNRTSLGTILTMLYVSQHKEDWVADKKDLASGEMIAYVYNIDAPYCSEFGYVGIKPQWGGLVRTY